jgi:hypothetical protein
MMVVLQLAQPVGFNLLLCRQHDAEEMKIGEKGDSEE